MGDALLNYKVNEGLMSDEVKLFEGNQQPRRKRRGCCSHKVVAVGFNTLCYDASVGVLNPPHE